MVFLNDSWMFCISSVMSFLSVSSLNFGVRTFLIELALSFDSGGETTTFLIELELSSNLGRELRSFLNLLELSFNTGGETRTFLKEIFLLLTISISIYLLSASFGWTIILFECKSFFSVNYLATIFLAEMISWALVLSRIITGIIYYSLT